MGTKRVPWSVVDEHLRTTLERVKNLPLPHEGSTPPRSSEAGEEQSGTATHKFAAVPSNVTILQGFGRLVDPNTIEIRSSGGSNAALLQTITSNVVLIASGSVPSHLPGIPFDGRFVFDSDDITTIGRTPHKIVVQGAGIIGIEYAFIMRQLGAEVTVIEFMPALLSALDVDVHEAIVEQLKRTGIKVHLNAILEVLEVPPPPADPSKETAADRDRPESVRVRVRPRGKGSVPFEIKCDAVMSATGRVGNTAGMNLEGIGCTVNRRCGVDCCFLPRSPRSCVENLILVLTCAPDIVTVDTASKCKTDLNGLVWGVCTRQGT